MDETCRAAVLLDRESEEVPCLLERMGVLVERCPQAGACGSALVHVFIRKPPNPNVGVDRLRTEEEANGSDLLELIGQQPEPT
jgi:hypothetical protein